MTRITNEELRADFESKLITAKKVQVYYIDEYGHSIKWPELTPELEHIARITVRMSENKSELRLLLSRGSAIIEARDIPLVRVCMVMILIGIGVATEEQFWFPRGGGRLMPFIND